MTNSLAALRTWTVEPLSPEVAKSAERLRSADDVRHVVLLPDVHLAKEVCVGVVVATTRLLYPAAVGGDIGCGMAAVAVDAPADLLDDDRRAARLLAALYRQAPFNRHSTRRDWPASLQGVSLSAAALDRLAGRDGRVQIGTLGRGNHFLEFQADDEGRAWVMVHSGSRGMGQAITSHHLRAAAGERTRWAPPPGSFGPECERRRGVGHDSPAGLTCLDSLTDAGRAYLGDVAWARTYAAENRLAMLRAVEAILADQCAVPLDWSTLIHSDHDHVRRETHFGEELWVHRKGAQSAAAGEPGIIPGSMGTATYHVEGRGCEASLLSCSHGAGRRLSRDAARRTIGLRQLERQLAGVRYDHRRGHALRDESPAAYKDIESVLRAQKDLVRIVRRLRPLLSYKGT